jgi:adenine-specific DNA-methyltransferase
LKEYMLNRVTLLRIHRFDPAEVQFGDALVSSAVVVLRNAVPPEDHAVDFTYGGTLARPAQKQSLPGEALDPSAKWTRLAHATGNRAGGKVHLKISDLFSIKRGIATGANSFFVLPESKAADLELPHRFLRPILPSPRFLSTDEIDADPRGNPTIEPRLTLLDCRLDEDTVRQEWPSLWSYLEAGRALGVHERYLCRHRNPWYSQEDREPPPILCTYMGRTARDGSAFRFLLNHSKAIAANVYLLLYPKPRLARMMLDRPEVLRGLWLGLKAIPWAAMLGVGRVYGGGLHKMEPKELAEAPADALLEVLPEAAQPTERQLTISW